MYTTKEEQILAIKKRLNEAVDKINISTNKLKDELNDKYGYEINYETLNNTLKETLKYLKSHSNQKNTKHMKQ